MSITKRRLEILEWIETQQDRLLDDRISQPIARHLLRKLPSDIQLSWLNASASQDGSHQDGHSTSSPRNYERHEAHVLQKLRYSVTSVCMAWLTDPDLEDLYFSKGFETTEVALGDHDAISADAFLLKDEIDDFQDEFHEGTTGFEHVALFGETNNGPLESTDYLLSGVDAWQRYSKGKAHWSFWREWYQGFLDGKPMDWELQRRVAMISDEDWEKGPEHIARVIEEIRARFELEKRLQALETEKLFWEVQGRHSVGGNNPPEPIEEAVVQEFILEPIAALQAETQEAAPDKARVRSAISKLTAVLVASGKWVGQKLDMAVDECVKSIGKLAGPALLGWIGLNSDRLIEIVKLAKDWLAAL